MDKARNPGGEEQNPEVDEPHDSDADEAEHREQDSEQWQDEDEDVITHYHQRNPASHPPKIDTL